MNTPNQGTSATTVRAGNNESEVTAVIEQVIERVKHILNHFEQVVDEVFNVIEMVRELFREIKDLFTLRSRAGQEDEYLEYAH